MVFLIFTFLCSVSWLELLAYLFILPISLISWCGEYPKDQSYESRLLRSKYFKLYGKNEKEQSLEDLKTLCDGTWLWALVTLIGKLTGVARNKINEFTLLSQFPYYFLCIALLQGDSLCSWLAALPG